MLTDFKGIQEMGFIAGAGLLLCLLPMLTLLPLLLAKRDRARRTQKPRVRMAPACIEQTWLRHPKILLGCAAAFTVFCLVNLPFLRFDYNLLNLQSSDLPAVQIEQKLIEASTQSLLYGVVMADSLEQATRLQRKLEKLPEVASVTSMVDYLSEDQSPKLQRIRQIQEKAESLKLPAPDQTPVNLRELGDTLYYLQGYLGWAPYFLGKDKASLETAAEMEALRNSVVRLRALIASEDAQAAARLTTFQTQVFSNLREMIQGVRGQDAQLGLRTEDIPAFLRERFISPSGKFLLQVHPRADVWQRDAQQEFLTAVRKIAPDVTGTVVQIHEYTSLLKDNFVSATGYASVVILIILLVLFRNVGSAILAFVPMALGLCWTVGLMAFFDMPFNPVNIMALTLLTGIGVSNGIHILVRFAEDARPTILAKSTGKAIVVSAFTTMAGFGSLMVARHEGISSLGAVMAIGTGMCLVASLTVMPALLILLNKRRESVSTPAAAPAPEEPVAVPAALGTLATAFSVSARPRPVFQRNFPLDQVHASFKSDTKPFPEHWA